MEEAEQRQGAAALRERRAMHNALCTSFLLRYAMDRRAVTAANHARCAAVECEVRPAAPACVMSISPLPPPPLNSASPLAPPPAPALASGMA